MYRALCAAFDVANDDDNVVLTVLTGKGSYYSAGSDFSPAEMAAENKFVYLIKYKRNSGCQKEKLITMRLINYGLTVSSGIKNLLLPLLMDRLLGYLSQL